MRRIVIAALAALGVSVPVHGAGAQALGPQRQFLAIEPYYERTQLDVGTAASREGLNGFGARLWINFAPFHFIPNSSIALFGSHAPSQSGRSVSLTTFGAEYDQFFVKRPLGGIIDPFVTVGGGGTRIQNERSAVFGRVGSAHTYGTLIPGVGVRIPIPNRFELRGDVKDAIIFNTPTGARGASRTSSNLLLQAALGLTF